MVLSNFKYNDYPPKSTRHWINGMRENKTSNGSLKNFRWSYKFTQRDLPHFHCSRLIKTYVAIA